MFSVTVFLMVLVQGRMGVIVGHGLSVGLGGNMVAVVVRDAHSVPSTEPGESGSWESQEVKGLREI